MFFAFLVCINFKINKFKKLKKKSSIWMLSLNWFNLIMNWFYIINNFLSLSFSRELFWISSINWILDAFNRWFFAWILGKPLVSWFQNCLSLYQSQSKHPTYIGFSIWSPYKPTKPKLPTPPKQTLQIIQSSYPKTTKPQNHLLQIKHSKSLLALAKATTSGVVLFGWLRQHWVEERGN